ncbi:hypothetical protein HRbin41_00753 [bacterium HR41]|jgi:pilus assembly protein TadC|nr:hypothetical protein HRbin41_00753 [bacterium HR41]
MAAKRQPRKVLDPAPPRGELVHMPEPSYLPVVTAAGIALILVGLVFSVIVSAIGAVVTAIATAIWIGKVRREMAELPLEHDHH